MQSGLAYSLGVAAVYGLVVWFVTLVPYKYG